MADEKKYLRRVLKEARAALPESLAAKLSDEIQTRVLALDCYRRASTVVLYSPKDNEVATGKIAADALAARRRVAYPRVDAAGRGCLVAVSDLAELRPGSFGILEPAGKVVIETAELRDAVVLVPGLAFSPGGQRLGRGGGFYDRLLERSGEGTVAIGLSYSFQLLDALPEGRRDQRLHYVATESAIHAASPGGTRAGGQTDQGGIPRCNG